MSLYDPSERDDETTTLPDTPPIQQGAPAPADVMPELPSPAAAPPAAAPPASPSVPPQGAQQMRQFQDVFRDPQALKSIALTFLKHGDSEGLAWLKQAHDAASENMHEAIGHLDDGDPNAAMQAFNSSGRFQLSGLAKNDDGTYTATMADDGRQLTFDPDKLRRGLLSPHDYYQHQVSQQNAATEAKKGDASINLMGAQADNARNMSDYKTADLESKQRIAAMNAASRIESTEMRSTRDAALQRAATAEAAANAKYGAGQLYRGYLTEALKSGSPNDAPQAALKAVIATPGAVIVKPNPQTGEVYLIDAKTNDMFQVLPNADAYKTITGSELYIPKGSPSNAWPAGVARAQPSKPPATAAGMTVVPSPSAPTPQPPTNGIPSLEDRMRARAVSDDAVAGGSAASKLFAEGRDQATALRAQFDADAGAMPPRALAQKYMSLVSALRPDQVAVVRGQ